MSKFFGKRINTQTRDNSLSSSVSSISSAVSIPSSPQSAHSVKETSDENIVIVKSIDPSSGLKMINKYQIVREIGRGVHGKVKLCFDTSTNTYYALKVLHRNKTRKFGKLTSDDLSRIKREIAIMKKLNHPNIVHLYEVIDDPSQEKIYLVLEYVDGGELEWKDESGDPVLSMVEVKLYLLQLIVGLEYLHFQGIIHRDVKPQNILITKSSDPMSRVKIADFGVSFFNERLQTTDVLDDLELAKTAGSPAFFAPELCADDSVGNSKEDLNNNNNNDDGSLIKEQLLKDALTPITEEDQFRWDEKPNFSVGTATGNSALFEGTKSEDDLEHRKTHRAIGKAIDVWALGVTLYCMVYGRLPFIANSEYELFSIIPRTPVSYPPDTPRGDLQNNDPELIDLISKFLEKDSNKRITLSQAKRHPWLLSVVPGASLSEKEEWLRNSSPEIYCIQQTNVYDDQGRIRVTDSEIREAVTVGVVLKRMVEAFKRRFSRGVSGLISPLPGQSSNSLNDDTKSPTSKWTWPRRTSGFFQPNQSLRRNSNKSENEGVLTSTLKENLDNSHSFKFHRRSSSMPIVGSAESGDSSELRKHAIQSAAAASVHSNSSNNSAID